MDWLARWLAVCGCNAMEMRWEKDLGHPVFRNNCFVSALEVSGLGGWLGGWMRHFYAPLYLICLMTAALKSIAE